MLPHRTTAPTLKTFRKAREEPLSLIGRPAVRATLAARLRGHALDTALIGGADPAAAPQLTARVALLTSRKSREGLAEGLERLLEGARGPRRRWWALARRDALLENASDIRAVAALLRGCSPVYASGVAAVREMLADSTGPAYRGDGRELAQHLAAVRTALAHGTVA